MLVVTNKNVWPCTERWGEFRKTRDGSGEGFRYLMFSLYKDTLKYVQIHIYQAYLKGKVYS